ncbi:MAG: hypothetical protein HRS50_02505 [Mycoplasmataceae bacterium]|nr:hypothetical protein [Mycoplasmataceae bacterium]
MSKKIIKKVLDKVRESAKDKFRDLTGIKEILDKLERDKDLINEIDIDIQNSNKQAQTQAIIMGVPFDKYEEQRNLKDKCLLIVENNEKETIKISLEEKSFLDIWKGTTFNCRLVKDEYVNVFFSLRSKGVIERVTNIDKTNKNKYYADTVIQTKFKLIVEE